MLLPPEKINVFLFRDHKKKLPDDKWEDVYDKFRFHYKDYNPVTDKKYRTGFNCMNHDENHQKVNN